MILCSMSGVLGLGGAQRGPSGSASRSGRPDPIFQGASYLDRVAIMCERMRYSGLYHLVWALGITRSPVGFGPAPTNRAPAPRSSRSHGANGAGSQAPLSKA
jgi:hypothetical protein